MAFDLASVLKNVSTLDTAREQIEYIALEDIAADPRNFYSITDISDLAANIELVGLQQPLRVRKTIGIDGLPTYVIVSGHRRFAALRLLAQENESFTHVPCIIETGAASEAMQELRLIYANSSTRLLRPFELEKQAERVRTLLYQLKAEGVEFPGRMRDHVAEACRISKSKLGRLDNIRNNLSAMAYSAWEHGRLSESAALELCIHPRETQDEIITNFKDKQKFSLTQSDITIEANRIYQRQRRDFLAKVSQGTEPEDPDEEDEIVPNLGTTPEDEKATCVDVPNLGTILKDRKTTCVDVPNLGTIPKPRWFTGEPPFNGPYVCKVSFDGKPFGRSLNLNRKDDQWMIPAASSPIDERTAVIGWWPVPEI